MPETAFSIHATGRCLLLAGVMFASLCGCSTTKKDADAAETNQAEPAGVQAEANAPGTAPALAKAGYVDPMVATTQGHASTARPVPPSLAPGSPATAGNQTFPPAPAQPAGSIAGLTTQPTGVRAGTSSIFSAAPAPVMSGAPSQAAGGAQSPGISATTGSVFAPRQPLAQPACPTDQTSRPVNC